MGLPLRSPVAKLSCDAATEENAELVQLVKEAVRFCFG